MLSHFDWIRSCRQGTELLVVTRGLNNHASLFATENTGPAGPYMASTGPCYRCWVYPRQKTTGAGWQYCRTCHHIIKESSQLWSQSRHLVVVWGFVNQLLAQFREGQGFIDSRILSSYVHDVNHFLLLMYRKELKTWLQELGLYHGHNLKGLLVIFPTISSVPGLNMGDVLTAAISEEKKYPLDMLRVQFFATPYEVIKPKVRHRQKILTFDISEFIQYLGMAEVFRSVLTYEEQLVLKEILKLTNEKEVNFYWGRSLGQFSAAARDIVDGWNLRNWKLSQLKLLYELVDYANFIRFD